MKKSDRPASVAVIGAGWAGLSAAWRLRRNGHNVTIYEMAPVPGGRARRATLQLAGQSLKLDNGQHMLIGAYRDSLALIRKAHDLQSADPIPGLTRVPLQVESTRMSLRARGPGQLGLLSGILAARGISLGSRLRIVQMAVGLRLAGWQTRADETVGGLLARHKQTDEAVIGFWSPMCLAALNTPLETASAQVFVNVLHDSMFAGAGGSDFLIPTHDLGSLFADPMLRNLTSMGVHCHLASPVLAITMLGSGRWEIARRDEVDDHDAVVLAASTTGAARLLAPVVPEAAKALERIQYESIQTVYMAWPEAHAPALPAVTRLDDDAAGGLPAQWLFARQPQHELALAAAVISVSSDQPDDNNVTVAARVASQVQRQLGLPRPLDARTVHEKRATFSCVPGRPLADCRQVDGHDLPETLRLAGDYCWARYPSTLEGAVRSGAQAAADLSAQLLNESG